MRAHFGLPSVESELLEGKPPIQVKFEIPYFTTSGIQVIWFNLFFLQVDSVYAQFTIKVSVQHISFRPI